MLGYGARKQFFDGINIQITQQMSTPTFKQFAAGEEKMEKKDFESAEPGLPSLMWLYTLLGTAVQGSGLTAVQGTAVQGSGLPALNTLGDPQIKELESVLKAMPLQTAEVAADFLIHHPIMLADAAASPCDTKAFNALETLTDDIPDRDIKTSMKTFVKFKSENTCSLSEHQKFERDQQNKIVNDDIDDFVRRLGSSEDPIRGLGAINKLTDIEKINTENLDPKIKTKVETMQTFTAKIAQLDKKLFNFFYDDFSPEKFIKLKEEFKKGQEKQTEGQTEVLNTAIKKVYEQINNEFDLLEEAYTELKAIDYDDVTLQQFLMERNTYKVGRKIERGIDKLKIKYAANKTVQLILDEALHRLKDRKKHLQLTRNLEPQRGPSCSIM